MRSITMGITISMRLLLRFKSINMITPNWVLFFYFEGMSDERKNLGL